MLTDGEGAPKSGRMARCLTLFREGQGIVADGRFQPDGQFIAATVLAKHDETYMPREVADKLKERGLWKEETGQ